MADKIVSYLPVIAVFTLGCMVFSVSMHIFFLNKKSNFSFNFEWLIIKRLLTAKYNNKIISIITYISIIAVMLACAGMIVAASVINGFSNNLRDKILSINPHIVLMSHENDFSGYEKILKETFKISDIESANPFILNEAILSFNVNTAGVIVKGITNDQYNVLNKIKTKALAAFNFDNKIIIGGEMKKKFKITHGDLVDIISLTKNTIGLIDPVPQIENFKVVGNFNTGISEYDTRLVYIPLKKAQILFNKQELITGIEYKVKDPNGVIEISDKIIKAVKGYPFYTSNWIEANKPLISALKLEKIAIFTIFIIIFCMANFLILFSLITAVFDKSREISILKSMGSSSNSIMNIFVLYGLFVGLIGTFLGHILGLGLCILLQQINIDFNSELYCFNKFPIDIKKNQLFLITFCTLAISFLTTIIPAFLAARCKPSDGLKLKI